MGGNLIGPSLSNFRSESYRNSYLSDFSLCRTECQLVDSLGSEGMGLIMRQIDITESKKSPVLKETLQT